MIRGGLLISFRLQLVFLWLPTSFLLALLLVTSFLVTRFHSNRPQTSSLSLGGRLLTAPRWGDVERMVRGYTCCSSPAQTRICFWLFTFLFHSLFIFAFYVLYLAFT
jgi:hypothetical protein